MQAAPIHLVKRLDMEYNAETDVPEYNRLLDECISRRSNAYIEELGGWQQQMDLIFHDMDAWKSAVQSIKDRFPKP